MIEQQVISPVADVFGAPDATLPRGKFESQLVYGESFIVEAEQDEWCKGACAHDGYAGYVESRHLTKNVTPATHIVTAARSHIYRNNSIKSPKVDTLSFGSLVAVASTLDGWAEMSSGAWIYQKHISPAASFDKDHIATARTFLETPYYWGGRSGFGMDCSGLVQMSLARAGITVQRDTEMQQGTIGAATDTPRQGDFVFFPGHVGIMADDRSLIHATAFPMKVTLEPLDVVAARSGGITAIRRV